MGWQCRYDLKTGNFLTCYPTLHTHFGRLTSTLACQENTATICKNEAQIATVLPDTEQYMTLCHLWLRKDTVLSEISHCHDLKAALGICQAHIQVLDSWPWANAKLCIQGLKGKIKPRFLLWGRANTHFTNLKLPWSRLQHLYYENQSFQAELTCSCYPRQHLCQALQRISAFLDEGRERQVPDKKSWNICPVPGSRHLDPGCSCFHYVIVFLWTCVFSYSFALSLTE